MSLQFPDSVELSPATADALDALDVTAGVGRINVNLPEMAWLVLVLKELPDSERTFPRGKWATIQHIEGQLREAAKLRADDVSAGKRE